MAKTFYTDCNIENQIDSTKQKYRITIAPRPKNCGSCPLKACGYFEDDIICNLTESKIDYYRDLDKIAKDCPLIEV